MLRSLKDVDEARKQAAVLLEDLHNAAVKETEIARAIRDVEEKLPKLRAELSEAQARSRNLRQQRDEIQKHLREVESLLAGRTPKRHAILLSIEAQDGWRLARIQREGESPIMLATFRRGAAVLLARLDAGKRIFIDKAPCDDDFAGKVLQEVAASAALEETIP